jgi:hypothetical protein
MLAVTSWPFCVTSLFRGMPGLGQSRPRLLLCWRVCMQALDPGRQTWEELARWTPGSRTAWRWRRVLTAASWHLPLLRAWGVQAACHPLPPPTDGTRDLGGEGRVQATRGTPHPVAHKGRQSEQQPGWGGRCARLLATWERDRFPVAFRLMRPPTPPASRTAKARCRELVQPFVPPAWAQRVLVGGEAASGSQEHRPRVRQRGADAPARRWGLVCAMARPWHTGEAKASKALVTHVPRTYAPRVRGPRLPGRQGWKTCWVESPRLCLRPSGDVTVGRRKKGRNVGPKQTQILGTKRDEWTPRQVVGADPRRWPVEPSKRERKTDLGRGAPQVRGEAGRSEHSCGIAALASVFRIRACHQAMLPGTSWSIAQLQHALR